MKDRFGKHNRIFAVMQGIALDTNTAALDRLREMQSELKQRLARIAKSTGIELDPDFSEQAIQLQNSEVLDELAREALEELSQINQAIRRHETGTFGACARCGKTIAEARLEALPWAVLCIDCADQ